MTGHKLKPAMALVGSQNEDGYAPIGGWGDASQERGVAPGLTA